MSRRFTGTCWTCGGQGHRARECLNSQHQQQAPLTLSGIARIFATAGASVAHEPQPTTAPQAPENVKKEPGLESPAATVAGRAGNIKKEPGLESPAVTAKSEQSTQEVEGPPWEMAPYSAQAIQRAMAQMEARRPAPLNMLSLPVTRRSERPLQGQAGRGSLPGARNAQPNQPDSGVLGNPRVARAGGSCGRRGARREPFGWDGEGRSGARGSQRDQPTHSRESRRQLTPTAPRTVVGSNLTAEQVVAMADQAVRAQPQVMHWDVELQLKPAWSLSKGCADSSESPSQSRSETDSSQSNGSRSQD